MNEAALYVCQKFKDIFLAYGQSDEYSFALVRDAELFNRRIDKI
jgi:tRNA(His) 5'-end guanylyltransferase